MGISNNEFTRSFLERMDDPEFAKEAQERGRAMLRDHIRETSFTDQLLKRSSASLSDPDIIPPREGNLPVWRAEIEPESRALTVNLASRADAQVIQAPRVDFPFFTLETKWYQATEEELMVYQGSLVDRIKKNTDDDIGDPLDLLWLSHMESAVRFIQDEVNNSGSPVSYGMPEVAAGAIADSIVKGDNVIASAGDDFDLYAPAKNDFVKLRNLRGSRKRVRINRALITENDHTKLSSLQAEDIGLKNTDDVAFKGWTANEFVGLQLIKTIKGDILREGNVYGLSEEDFIGRSLVLRDIQFWAEKRARQFAMMAWCTRCLGLVNIQSVVKLELYGGSSYVGYTDTGFEGVVPVAEEDLGQQQNRVQSDGYYPNTDII